ncbi:pentapeptide repeat-containing protein [Vibrio algarum]|uniref:Pentapeptide repeat-containing protein n=1 Tax=Vibrio algarum TaxID=3020714 RepID=A0ABT4YL36_9VIBR|nr:pentapeptide repeat-containing protein [Vibrio sp. KJ40-1]MDB1122247.1 pentapeptide repeat-containing protein [Vibrio sp. KJ40-1]
MQGKYTGLNFDYENFDRKFLDGIEFKNCTFRHCSFKGADLSHVIFTDCDLYCANFEGAVLYFTRVISCDGTKAIFKNAMLNGIRFKDTICTSIDFGDEAKLGYERKRINDEDIISSFYTVKRGDIIPDIHELESSQPGIRRMNSDHGYIFKRKEDDLNRTYKRKSEVYKSIYRVLMDNNYSGHATSYYYKHRKYLRMSKGRNISSFFEYVLSELIWGYGVKVKNPIISFLLNIFFFSLIYMVIPLINNQGVMLDGDLLSPLSCNSNGLVEYLNLVYISLLISCLSVFGDISLIGIAKVFVVIQLIFSVVSLGLTISVFTKKMSHF